MKISNIIQESFQGDKVLQDPRLVKGIGLHFSTDHTVPGDLRPRYGRRPDIRPGRQAEDKKRQDDWDQRVAQMFVAAMDEWDAEARKRKMVYNVQPGQYDQWMAGVYAAGGTSWEDLEARAPRALYDFNLLTRKKKIDPRHADIYGYNSVAKLERYVDVHYDRIRDELRQDAELERLAREAQAIKLADNDKYLLLAVVNRGAACKYGKGTRWCTSSTSSERYFRQYSEDSPLFILLDKQDGEKYQWHFTSNQFMDPADNRARPDKIRQQYPDLLQDLLQGIANNAQEWDKAPWDPPLSDYYGYKTAAGAIEKIKQSLAQPGGWRSFYDYFKGPIPGQGDQS